MEGTLSLPVNAADLQGKRAVSPQSRHEPGYAPMQASNHGKAKCSMYVAGLQIGRLFCHYSEPKYAMFPLDGTRYIEI